MIYILIILWHTANGATSQHVEFKSKQACEYAQYVVKKDKMEYSDVRAVCVAKGN